MPASPIIRPLNEHEVTTLVAWAADEGWNPGPHDAHAFRQANPEGFLALELDGEFIGGGACVRHNSTYGFMGLFIVKPEFRGQGYGTKLWYRRRDTLLSRLDANGTIGLDAVDAMIPFYEKGGFREFTRHRRFQWDEVAMDSPANPRIVDLKSIPFDRIKALDLQCFPGARDAYLKAWLDLPDAHALACEQQEQLMGYGVMRRCGTGWKIGPLFAEQPPIAKDLLLAFRDLANAGPIFLDIPDNNPHAVRMVEDFELREVFGCVRMYHGPVPELAHEKIFGITTLEIG